MADISVHCTGKRSDKAIIMERKRGATDILMFVSDGEDCRSLTSE